MKRTGTVVIADLGMGNLRSVERALERAASEVSAACEVRISADPDVVRTADRVVVPGQGAFRDCGAALRAGMGDALRDLIARGAPFLGICLGLQALFEASDEAPDATGLGVFAGRSVRLDQSPDAATGAAVKVPHMGWSRLALAGSGRGPLRVFDADPPFVYFVHSYHAVARDPSLVAATVRHGNNVVTAAVQRDNVTATQFHPEKSQQAGLRLLGAFLLET